MWYNGTNTTTKYNEVWPRNFHTHQHIECEQIPSEHKTAEASLLCSLAFDDFLSFTGIKTSLRIKEVFKELFVAVKIQKMTTLSGLLWDYQWIPSVLSCLLGIPEKFIKNNCHHNPFESHHASFLRLFSNMLWYFCQDAESVREEKRALFS